MSKWTNEQQNAIDARNTGVIVSAAAGSGKTSVLVERLLGILSDTANQIPADRLIVVTYTKDAAAQMKQRLSDALSKAIVQNPDNLWLCSQQALLQTAKISTIHSFCFDLIRENIHLLDISAGFRILDETEEAILKAKAVENVFERMYSESVEEMEMLADFFSKSDRTDSELESVLLKLFSMLESVPFCDDWLAELENYYGEGFIPESDSLADIFADNLRSSYLTAMSQAEYAQKEYLRVMGKTAVRIEDDISAMRVMLNNFGDKSLDWDSRFAYLVKSGRAKAKLFPAVKKNDADAPKIDDSVKDEIWTLCKTYEKTLSDAADSVFTFADIQSDYKVHAEIIASLRRLVSMFGDELFRLKTEKNALGFSDAEQLAIKLLAEKDESGNIVKTELAYKLSNYYSMIMIDEFQDANNNQDLIFKMLSKDGTAEKGGTNLFVVGDMKQSIYRFRLANPKLFTDALSKAESYTGKDFSGTNASILLNKNFRSSDKVIGFANYLFGNLMSTATGEVDYTSEQALVQGLKYPDGDRTTEIILVPSEPASEDGEAIINEEAYAAAQKIKSMLGVKEVCDNGRMRPSEPRDFCILVRTNPQAEAYVRTLADAGIKAYAEEPKGYLESREISVLINLLAVIDNPMQDIPLTSVLMSPMFMLTAEDMAKLALVKEKNRRYFHAIRQTLDGATSITPQDELYVKLSRFMQVFEKLRYCASSQRLERFIRTIYDSTDFLSAVQVYKDGSQKRANLRLLLDVAESYEKNSGGGVSGFVRYIDMILRRDGDLKRASTVSAADNVVSVKTMHKSKGLEYPFVFICGTSKNFNEMDLKNNMLINLDYGIGMKIQDRKNLKLYNSFPRAVIRMVEKSNLKSEEMRLMYVAVTRAREQLFITVPNNEKVCENNSRIVSKIVMSGGLTSGIVSGGRSMLDWISMAMAVHPDGKWFRGEGPVPVSDTGVPVRVTESAFDEAEVQTEKTLDIAFPDDSQVKLLKENFSFRYDSGLTEKAAKITVTEIAKSSGGEKLFLRRPEFAAEKGGLTAAEKGTAMHSFMQYADYAAAESDVMAEADRLADKGLIGSEERDGLNFVQLGEFFRSELYQRMKKSDSVRREQKFLIKKSDSALDDERIKEYNEDSMLQGIADCMFEEDGGIILVDYKTDRVSSESTLVNRYDLQLRLYSASLSAIFGKPVKEAYLYSFALGRAIRVG